MKNIEKQIARRLRQEGKSINFIKDKLKVSKSSVSLWVRDIKLSHNHVADLKQAQHGTEAIEKRRLARLKNELQKRQIIIDEAKSQIRSISETSLFHIGLALYWAEGSKTNRGNIQFSNSDPKLIQIMMKFFSDVCKVPNKKFRGHLYLHRHLNVKRSEKYWAKISGIPLNQFTKTTLQLSQASKSKKDSLPYGTFSINVHDTKLFLKIQGWCEGLHQIIIK